MGSDTLLMLLIGLAGIVIGVAAVILITRRPVPPKKYESKKAETAETVSVGGEAVDVRELRILRSLFGESRGRRMGSFKDKYYRPSLEATIDKGWVKHVGSRYFMTPKGKELCQTYLTQLLSEWKPEEE
jgi:hypothetical protein